MRRRWGRSNLVLTSRHRLTWRFIRRNELLVCGVQRRTAPLRFRPWQGGRASTERVKLGVAAAVEAGDTLVGCADTGHRVCDRPRLQIVVVVVDAGQPVVLQVMIREEDKVHRSSNVVAPAASLPDSRSDQGPVEFDPSRRNVVLTGFMGTGKTTVGQLLADRLGFAFVDTDAAIESRYGPIPEIFRLNGEAAFRQYEHEVAVEFGALTSFVVSTGGRLLLDPANAAVLSRTGSVFCLTATIETILDRVMTGNAAQSRPLLAGSNVRQRVETLLTDRAEGYGQFTPVRTDGRDPESIVDEIIELLANRRIAPSTTSNAKPDQV